MMRGVGLLMAGCALALATGAAAQPADPLAAGFANPPESARPRVWWHWLNGNITEQGIRDDLAWMHRVGIGGAQTFDASLGTPQIVDKRLVYMTPAWKQAFRVAATTADQYGLELGIAASPGWSETGGPWVQPKDGLKKLVWSETEVVGGRRFKGKLAPPPGITGPFGSVPFDDLLAAMSGGAATPPTWYADVAVLAYRDDAPAVPAPAQVTAGGTVVDAATLADADLVSGADVAKGTADAPTAIVFSYAAPTTLRSATIFIPHARTMFSLPTILPVLEVQEGSGWRKLAELPLTEVPTTVGFAAATSRVFRVVLGPNPQPPRPELGDGAPGAVMGSVIPEHAPTPTIRVNDLRLFGEAKVDRAEAKAGFTIARDYYALATTAGDDRGVDPATVIDLTRKLRPDGTLDWTPPAGRWRVVRLGASLLGTTNHPATPEATGLEVDKFDGAAVKGYIDHYLATYRDAAGAGMVGAHGVRAMVTDSIEVGAANWTPRMIEQFRKLRGYEPTPWLPALTGTIVGSRVATDAFLYDYRRTLADLMASEHYGTVADAAHRQGITLYGEALEDARPSLGDDMAMRAHANVPMAAMWTYNRGSEPRPTLLGDTKGAASVAHLYGQNLVAAESLTAAFSPWAYAPSDIKRIIDLEFVQGINRPVIHTSVHQPTDDKLPGLSLAIFGQYFNRHETWAEMAKPWVDYIARSSFMLQQGRYQADVAYFYGEEAPLTALYAERPLADVPTRNGFDFVNPDVLSDRLSVEGGELVAPTGARYRLLYLGGTSQRMTLPVLKRIAALVEAGATVVGDRPTGSPALSDDPAAFAALAARLWGGGAVTAVGNGRVIAGKDVEAALASIGAGPDFDYVPADPQTKLLFLHRKLADGDVYFVSNRANRAAHVETRFGVTGLVPQLWHAETGTGEPVSYRTEGKQTVVPLDLDPEGAVFVVFRGAGAASATVAAPIWRTLGSVRGGWTVAFQPKRGAPATINIAALKPLNESGDPRVKYFSGEATYTTGFALPAGTRPGAPLMLDLGQVGDLAEVRVNGVLVGTAWHAPYRLDIGGAVRAGRNALSVKVADLWVNRLIGDAQPGAKPITWTPLPTYKPDAPLRPSGLIGPVTLLTRD